MTKKQQSKEEYLNPQLVPHAGLERKTKEGVALLKRMRSSLNDGTERRTLRPESDNNSDTE